MFPNRNQKLQLRVKELELEKEHQARMHLAELRELKAESQVAMAQKEGDLQNASLKERVAQLEARLKEAPKPDYERLNEILKALVVKLPTLEIKELSVRTKGK